MPEYNNKERTLEGTTTIIPSSDEAIKATLNQLISELDSLPNPEVIIEGEPLSLKPTDSISVVRNQQSIVGKKPLDIKLFRPTDSALGNLLTQDRSKKKAA